MIHSPLLLVAASVALSGAAAPSIANGAPGHGWNGPRPGAHISRPGGNWGSHRWGPRQNGRWFAGWGAPGGWGSYRRPVRGYMLPRYWINPTYYIANYSAYGFPAPFYGYGWSRYYDDAVMTDQYGRVYDYRSNVDWDRYEGGYAPDGAYGDGYYDAPRRDNGLGGAAVGAVIGGVAGNRIAGKGDRVLGTAVGAVAGAVAGNVIDKAEDKGLRRECDDYFASIQPQAYPGTPSPGYYPGYAPYGYVMVPVMLPPQKPCVEKTVVTETWVETKRSRVIPPRPRIIKDKRVKEKRVYTG